MAGQEPLRQFRDVKDAVYRYDSVFASIKSPTELYEEKLRSIQDRIAQIWSELPSAPPDQTSRLQDNLIELAGQKKELEIDQKTNIEHYERIHAQKVRQTMDSFRDHLFQLMGTSSGQSQFQMTPDTTRLGTDRVESAPVEPEFPEQAPIIPVSADDEMDDGPMFHDNLMDDTMEDGADDDEPTEDILTQEDSVVQEPVETEPYNEEPTEEPTENPTEDEPFETEPTNEEPAEEETGDGETVEESAEEEPVERVSAEEEAGADSTEEPDNEQAAEAEPVERESVDDEPIASRTRKPGNRTKASSRDIAAREDISARHARYTFSPSPTPAAETITVQADESDDEEDDEEDESEEEEEEASETEFSEPDEAAPSPRQTRSGGTKRKGSFSSPMTKTKRQKSERASSTNKETQKDASTTEPTRRQTRLRQRHHDPTGADEFKGITNPKCGKVYLTYWDRTKEWLAVLILPMGSFDKIGIPGSIETCGLADSLPPCYQYDKVSREYTWAKSYETGNTLIRERMFPVMYFDGRDFPNRSAIDWIEAKDLRRFNPKLNNDLLPHIKEVDKYLKADPARAALQEDDEDGEGVPYKERTQSQAPKPEEPKKKKRKSSEHKTSGSSKAKTNSKKQAPATDTEVQKATPTPEQMAAHRAAALKPQVLRMIGHHNSSDKSKPTKTAAPKPATTAPAKTNEKDSNGRPASKPSSHKPAGPKTSGSKPGASNPARPAGKGSNQHAPSAHRSSGSKTPANSDPKPTAARPAEKESDQPTPKPSATKPSAGRPAERNASHFTPKPSSVRTVLKPAENESNQPAPKPSAPSPAESHQSNQVRTRSKPTGPRPIVTRTASGTPAEKEPSQPVTKPPAPKLTAPAEKISNPPAPKPTEHRPNKPAQTKPQAPVTAAPQVPPPVSGENQTEFEPQNDEPAPVLEDDSQAAPVQQQAPQPRADPSPLPPPPPPVPRAPRAPSAPPRPQSVPQPSNVSHHPLPVPSPVPRPASTRNPPRPLPGEDVKKEKKPIIVLDISDDDSDGAAEDNAAAARTLSQRASRAQVLQQLTAALEEDLTTSQQRTTAAQRTEADRLRAVGIALAALRRDEPSNSSAGQAWDRRPYDSTHRPVQGDVERTRAPLYSPAVTNISLPDQQQAQMVNTNRSIGRQLGSGSLPTPPAQSLPGPMDIDSYSSCPPYSAGPSPVGQPYRQPPPEQHSHLQQPQPRQAQASQQLLTEYMSATPSHPESLSRRPSHDQTPRIPEPPPTTQYWHAQGRLQQTHDPQQSPQNQYQPSQQSHASPVSTAHSVQYQRPDVQQQYNAQQPAPSHYQNTQYQAQQSPAQPYNQPPQPYQQQPSVQYQQPQPAQQYHAAHQPAPTQQYDTQAQTQPIERSTQRTPSLSHLMHRHLHESPQNNRNQVLPPLPQSSPPISSAQTHNQTSHTARLSFFSPYATPSKQPPPHAGQFPSVPTVASQQAVQHTAPLRTSHEWPTPYQNGQVQAQQAGASAERPSSSHYQSAPSNHSRSASGHTQNEQRPPHQPSTDNASQLYPSPHWNQQSTQVSNLPPPRPLAAIDQQLQQDPNLLPPLVSSNRPPERPTTNYLLPESIHPSFLDSGKMVLARHRDSLKHNPNNQHLQQPITQPRFAKLNQLRDLGPHRYNQCHLRKQLLINKLSLSLVRPVISETIASTHQPEPATAEANNFNPWVQVDLNLPQDPPDWGDSMPFELVEFISEWERLRSLRQGLGGLRNHKGGLECLFCTGPERVPYVYDRKNYFEKHLLHHWQRVKKLHPEGPDPTPRPIQRQQQYIFRDGTANLNI
ncbi:hypothetical protein ACKAV7_014819 [Fusarium commune]